MGSTERARARKNGGLHKKGPVELARYILTSGERILYGQQIGEIVRITDRPAAGDDPSYLVERAIKRDANGGLKALLADYLCQAERLDRVPMAATPENRVEQVLLARYKLTGGERFLCGHRVDGTVCITDRPAAGAGRAYLVERGIQAEGYGALAALLSDYTMQAERLDAVPMAASATRCAPIAGRSRRVLARFAHANGREARRVAALARLR